MSVENELVTATKFKRKADDYTERQDYLADVVKAVDRLAHDKFEKLTDEAADWFNDAVKALNSKDDLPEFEGNGVDPDASADERKAANAAMEDGDELTGESEDNREGPEDKPSKIKKAKAGRPKKAVKEKSTRVADAEGEAEPATPRVRNGELEKDRFGVVLGTKTHQAVMMYAAEEGASLKEIDASIGGRFANILRRLTKDGHHVQKDPESGRFRLIHKDDFGSKAKAKSPS
jgi:hypothetical protein